MLHKWIVITNNIFVFVLFLFQKGHEFVLDCICGDFFCPVCAIRVFIEMHVYVEYQVFPAHHVQHQYFSGRFWQRIIYQILCACGELESGNISNVFCINKDKMQITEVFFFLICKRSCI